MTTARDRMTADELLARLERHYIAPGPLPGGTFASEVTYGRAGGSRADALYIGFTASSGRVLIGHEIKVSRSDWLAELAKPHKADTWCDECHEWYLVAPSTDVVRPEELPDGWGLLTADGNTRTRLTVVVKARTRTGHDPSWTAVRSIFARLDTLRMHRDTQRAADAQREAYDRLRKALKAENLGSIKQKAYFPLDELLAHVRREVDKRVACTPNDRTNLQAVQEALGVRLVFPLGDEDDDLPAYRAHRRLTLDDLRTLGPIAQGVVNARDELAATLGTRARLLESVIEGLTGAATAVGALRDLVQGNGVDGVHPAP